VEGLEVIAGEMRQEMVSRFPQLNEGQGNNDEEEVAKPHAKRKRRRHRRRRADKISDSEDESDEYKYESEGQQVNKVKVESDSDSSEDSSDEEVPAKNDGFTKAVRLSPELASLMGQEFMARHEVVKNVWSLIRERNLYDPNNKQFAICDEKLLPVFGVKRFRTFGMMKYLKQHFMMD